MKVADVIHVVNVQCAYSATERADGVLRLSAANGNVTEIKTNGECLGIVQRIIIASELDGVGANVVTNILRLRIALPHILDSDLYAVLLCKRCEPGVELHIHLKELLGVTVVSTALKRVNYNVLDSAKRSKLEGTGEGGHQLLSIIIISTAKGSVRLVENDSACIGHLAKLSGNLPIVVLEEERRGRMHGDVNCWKSRVHNDLHRALDTKAHFRYKSLS